MIAPVWTHALSEKVLALHRAGEKPYQIERHLNGSPSRRTIVRHLKQHGLIPLNESEIAALKRKQTREAAKAQAKDAPKREARPKAATSATVTSEPPPVEPRHWTTRKYRECAWPVSGNGENILSCCKQTQKGQTYCTEHRKRAYINKPPNPRPGTGHNLKYT